MPQIHDARDLKGKTGPKRLFNALKYSRDGIATAWHKEEAFRQEMVLAVVLVVVSFFLPLSLELHALVIMSTLLVLVIELLNSGIEAAIDRIGPEIHPLSKYAKDAGSAAVLIGLIQAGAVWFFALWAAARAAGWL